MHSIFVYHYTILEDILGPGKRLVIWLSGCPYNCKGCIEEKLRDINTGEKIHIDEFYNKISIIIDSLKAVTFTGGEPLYQKKVLLSLMRKFSEDVDVMLYTGVNLEKFNNNYVEFKSLIDILVSGSFNEALHGDYLWRGSANQIISSPSGKYIDIISKWMDEKSKGIELFINEGLFYIYGIPVPNTLEKINEILKEHKIMTE